ncbi:hypothetical protein J7394_09900 [Ruegeria sp. R13_0]|uniref:hypothetical protein n=1 Tax=Ruegeria sp. R13_0 TaxID=2821099 RepID=UPI001ADB6A7F|nr:hypothetical protein [Ruegeria sp. R13_0]MBO9434518.1 hypothetical protein [Ruegeria sp. R13_0]
MGKWKKSFRSIPAKLRADLANIEGENIKVLAGKIITPEEVDAGLYDHLGLTEERLIPVNSWEVLPPSTMGTRSKRNVEGWVQVRKDLPKFTKYFYHDIQNFGDGARYGWSTVAIPREVYERDEFPPFLFHIEARVQEVRPDGSFGVVFSVDEVLLRDTPDFDNDLLFAVNLLQENTGVSGVVSAENPEFVFTSSLNWELFPPGDLEAAVSELSRGRRPVPEETVRERLQLFEQFQPTEYMRGLGGNDHYIGAKYSDDLVVFENLKYGNALYVLYENWEELSQKPRNELLKQRTSQFDRIIHTDGWETRFAVLMQRELQERGIRIRIGRNMRRRYRR